MTPFSGSVTTVPFNPKPANSFETIWSEVSPPSSDWNSSSKSLFSGCTEVSIMDFAAGISALIRSIRSSDCFCVASIASLTAFLGSFPKMPLTHRITSTTSRSTSPATTNRTAGFFFSGCPGVWDGSADCCIFSRGAAVDCITPLSDSCSGCCIPLFSSISIFLSS